MALVQIPGAPPISGMTLGMPLILSYLYVLICKVEIIMVPMSWDCCEDQMSNYLSAQHLE